MFEPGSSKKFNLPVKSLLIGIQKSRLKGLSSFFGGLRGFFVCLFGGVGVSNVFVLFVFQFGGDHCFPKAPKNGTLRKETHS